jgi:UDP-N-acetylglucosamine:LPS N-acetylglucosamine transferase
MKICIVSSSGGHLTEVRALLPIYREHEHFSVLNERIPLPADMRDRTIFIRHSERDWLTLWNAFEALAILRRERPSVLISTGAGPIVPFAVIAKLFGIPVIFIETLTRISEPSLTGKLMYRLADRFFYQWPSLERFFPNGTYGGPLI